jgi:hypothetical protein
MDPASVFILLIVLVVALGAGVFLYFTTAGIALREGRRERRRRRPEHLRVDNDDQHIESSPPRTGPQRPAHPADRGG